MKYSRHILTAVAALSFTAQAFAQGAVPATCEYWLDHAFGSRLSSPMAQSGEWSTQIDMAQLAPGIHAIGLRVSDSKGRWGAPLIRHFFVEGKQHPMTGNTPTTLEYWIDHRFGERQAAELTNGAAELTLNLAQLSEGLHTLTYRAGDAYGQWTQPVVKNFIRTAEHTATPNALGSLTYWIDYKLADRQTTDVTDGTADLTLDLGALPRGLHTLSYYVSDTQGLVSAPATRHFVIPNLPPVGGDRITAYEYWFNHGPRVHVDVDPQNPLTLDNLWIDINDVVPNVIADTYRFDPSTATVRTPDNVFFGIQAFDNAGTPSMAVLSDTFAIDVDVHPNITQLTEKQPETFAPPAQGYIKGFRADVTAGDSLCFTVGGACRFDLFDANGNRLKTAVDKQFDSQYTYSFATPTARVYALLHTASYANSEMSVVYDVVASSGIGTTLADAGLKIVGGRGQIDVTSQRSAPLAVYTMAGACVASQQLEPGLTHISVAPGVYIVKTATGANVKVTVR